MASKVHATVGIPAPVPGAGSGSRKANSFAGFVRPTPASMACGFVGDKRPAARAARSTRIPASFAGRAALPVRSAANAVRAPFSGLMSRSAWSMRPRAPRPAPGSGVSSPQRPRGAPGGARAWPRAAAPQAKRRRLWVRSGIGGARQQGPQGGGAGRGRVSAGPLARAMRACSRPGARFRAGPAARFGVRIGRQGGARAAIARSGWARPDWSGNGPHPVPSGDGARARADRAILHWDMGS